jgi:hypothetical protein
LELSTAGRQSFRNWTLVQTSNTGHEIRLAQQQPNTSTSLHLLQYLVIDVAAEVQMLNALAVLAAVRMCKVWTRNGAWAFFDVVDALTINTFNLLGITVVLVQHVCNEIYLIDDVFRGVIVTKCWLIEAEFSNRSVNFVEKVRTRKWCHAYPRRNTDDT